VLTLPLPLSLGVALALVDKDALALLDQDATVVAERTDVREVIGVAVAVAARGDNDAAPLRDASALADADVLPAQEPVGAPDEDTEGLADAQADADGDVAADWVGDGVVEDERLARADREVVADTLTQALTKADADGERDLAGEVDARALDDGAPEVLGDPLALTEALTERDAERERAAVKVSVDDADARTVNVAALLSVAAVDTLTTVDPDRVAREEREELTDGVVDRTTLPLRVV